jgi:ribokinase
MRTLVVAGSLNCDLVVRVEGFPQPGETVPGFDLQFFCGGKGANQAFAAARLGAVVSMIGQVGNDGWGRAQINSLKNTGVNVDGILIHSALLTGTAMIFIDSKNQNQIIVTAGANRALFPNQIYPFKRLIHEAGCVLLQLEIPIETVLWLANESKQAGALVILDPAPAQPLSSELLQMIDYVTPNCTELSALSGAKVHEESSREDIIAAARVLLQQGAKKVIAKLGHKGALLISPENEVWIEAFPVNAVDPTAAGDCFNAAFATVLMEGKTEREALRFANAAAACSVTKLGAQASMPTRSEVLEFLEKFCF